ncbi:MAG: hypothetical protein O3A63_01405 [Proteobacteria bacterium]|nr:hypothetical protein [Pseudomonadota bacterium]
MTSNRQSPLAAAYAVLLIIFARKSPERLHYTRPRLVVSVFLAVICAFLAHLMFFGYPINDALLSIVARLGVFVVAVNQTAAADKTRHRVLKMMLALFLISAFGDATLVLLSFVPPSDNLAPVMIAGVMLIYIAQLVGAVNSVQYGLSNTWFTAALYVVAYLVVVYIFLALATPVLALLE